MPQQPHGVISLHGGEIPKEGLQRFAVQDLVDQCLHRHPSAAKDWRTAQNLRIDGDRQWLVHILTLPQPASAGCLAAHSFLVSPHFQALRPGMGLYLPEPLVWYRFL